MKGIRAFLLCALSAVKVWPIRLMMVSFEYSSTGVQGPERRCESCVPCRALGVELRGRHRQRHPGIGVGGVGSDEVLHRLQLCGGGPAALAAFLAARVARRG